MALNKLMVGFSASVSATLKGKHAPDLRGRTTRRLHITEVAQFVPQDSNGKNRPFGWYAACSKCDGKGVLDAPYAIADKYAIQDDRRTCFDCGHLNNGWFALPSLRDYQAFCLAWILLRESEGKQEEVVKVAKSEFAWITEHRPEYVKGDWLCEMARFWDCAITRLWDRREKGLPFFTDEEYREPSPALEVAVRALNTYFGNQPEEPVTPLLVRGIPGDLYEALSKAWENQE